MKIIREVLIAGAGVGGLTLAAALGQRGIHAEVVEIDPQPSTSGVGILQYGNALRALTTLGLLDACFDAGFQTDTYRYFDARGGPLATLRLMRIADPSRPAINMLPRPALQKILIDAALEAGASLRYGVTIASISETDNGVEVRFTDGRQGRYDLLVGADGIRSGVRDRVFGAVLPHFTGQGCWRVTLPRPPELDYQCMFMGVGVKAGLIPLTHDTMYMLVVTNEPGNPRMPADRLDVLLQERMRDFGGLVADARAAIHGPEAVLYVPIEEIILAPPWHRGRVLLIGDAAHASSPHIAQGAAMAVEDAVVLAELASGDLPLPLMLEAFMKRRYDRCRFVQDLSRQVGEDGAETDPARCAERDRRMREAFATPAPKPRPHEQVLAEPI